MAAADGNGPAQPAPARTRRQRAVTATDEEWDLIEKGAEAAGMPTSVYVVDRLTAPEPEPETDLGKFDRRLDRVERRLQALYEIEAHRLRQHGDDEVLDHVDGPPQPAPGQAGRPRRRAVTFSEDDWTVIGEHADACGMSPSDFVVHRSTAPEPAIGLERFDRRLERVERRAQVMYEIEAHRLRQHGDGEVLDRLEREADRIVDREHQLG